MPIINWTTAARSDLRRIDEYLSREATGEVALKVLSAIRSKATMLESFPSAGPELGSEHRYLGVTGTAYVIVYRHQRGRIDVLRIRHNREDWRPE